MRVGIVSISKVDRQQVFEFMESLKFEPTELLTSAKGAGSWWAESWTAGQIPIVRIEPDFKLYGAKAVPKAHDKMIFECDALVAFYDRKSKPVGDMIKYAIFKKKEVAICYVDDYQ